MRQKTQWETVRKVLRYIRRYRIYFVASILLASVNVFGTLMTICHPLADCTLYIHGSDCAVVYEPQQ